MFLEGWAETKLRDIVAFNPKHSADGDKDQLISFVPMSAVDEYFGQITDAIDRPLRDVWTGYTHFADRDVIFAKITPCMENGKAAVVQGMKNGLACGSTEFYVLRSSGAILPEYLWRYIRQPSFRTTAKAQMSGAVGQQRVPKEYLEEYDFSLPPLAEQRRIVAKLDALTTRLARARAELNRVPKAAKRLRQQTAMAAFEGKLTADWRYSNGITEPVADETLDAAYARISGTPRRKPSLQIEWCPGHDLPHSWRWVSVDQVVAMVQYGSSSKTSEDARGVPVLRMGNIQRGEIDWTDLKYLPQNHDEFPSLLLEVGDVIFNRTNSFELVGKSAVCKALERPTSFASYLIRVRTSGILPELLAIYLNSPMGRSWVERVASQQVGQANVNGSKLKALGIPLPSFDEQVEMLRRLQIAFARADRLEAEATRSLKLLDRLESAILAKAFRGELVPQDPNDEPASALLDSIRAQRIGTPAVGRTRKAKSK